MLFQEFIRCIYKIFLIAPILLVLSSPKPPTRLDIIIDSKFQIGELLGHGQYGIVYSGRNMVDGTAVAIKFSYHEYSHHLQSEFVIHQQLIGVHGIARAYFCGRYDSEYSVLVMQRLGRDVERFVPPHLSRLPADVLLQLAASLVQTFEGFHDRGLLHRDIKPNNLALGLAPDGTGDDMHQAYLFDFNRCDYYKNTTSGQLLPPTQQRPTRATSYTPPSLAMGHGYSRRDDLTALGYVLVHLAGHGLPWDCYHHREILTKMENTSPAVVAAGLPDAFRKYFEHLSSLGYYDRPDYRRLQQAFLDTDPAQLKAAAPWLPPSLCLAIMGP